MSKCMIFGATSEYKSTLRRPIGGAFSAIVGYNIDMNLPVELERFNAEPALADWVVSTIQKLLDQAQKDAAEITRRDTELLAAQTKIQALVLELAHLRRIRFGASSEALSAEQRDLFQESMASDIAAAQAELAKREAEAVAATNDTCYVPPCFGFPVSEHPEIHQGV
jgi:hypothetical protein